MCLSLLSLFAPVLSSSVVWIDYLAQQLFQQSPRIRSFLWEHLVWGIEGVHFELFERRKFAYRLFGACTFEEVDKVDVCVPHKLSSMYTSADQIFRVRKRTYFSTLFDSAGDGRDVDERGQLLPRLQVSARPKLKIELLDERIVEMHAGDRQLC